MQRFDWTSSAKFVEGRGSGVRVPASQLADYVGRGLYHEVWRDFEWQHISRVTPGVDAIEVEVITGHGELKKSKSSDGNTTIEVIESPINKATHTFAANDEILVSAEPVERPRSTRITITTTTVTETLDD